MDCRKGLAPADVGRSAAGYVLRSHEMTAGYTDSGAYYGLLIFAEATHDAALRDRAVQACAPFCWGRGNGWALAGMTELLLATRQDYPRRDQLMAAYCRLAKGLLDCQDETGMWRQLVDDPDAWPESSGTGMFIFGLATGVEQGWLPEKPCAKAVERAWRALANDYVDTEGRVKEVACGIPPDAHRTRDDYLATKRRIGDWHGQLALLWAATALERL